MLKNSKTAKFVAGFVSFAFAFSLFVTPVTSSAQTTAELQAMINSLLAQIAALQGQVGGGSTSGHTFTTDLTVGSTGSEVVALQQFLVSKGFLTMPAGVAMGNFGPLTQSALANYQAANGITPAAGYFGPVTRAKVNSQSTPSTPTTPTTPGTSSGLQGGAGSIEDADFTSGINNEEVGEDEEDVEVAGLDIAADDGSDLEITAVRLDFDQSTGATSDFEDYASEVSIWLDGEEFARVDADEFNDDNNYDKTISLDRGAIIEAGETATLTVGVSGINNLDSSDATDAWTVIISQVRVVDAQGASVTETATGDIGTETRTFTFESFATAANTEFKITEGDDSINDAHIIVVDTSNDTEDEPILAYNVEIEGDASVSVDKLPVGILVATQDNVDEMISGLTLWMDGEEVGSASLSSDCLEDSNCASVGTYEPYAFDDLGLTLEGGEEYEFVVKADFYPTVGTGDLTAGDTIQASTTATLIELGATYADIEDESGEDLAAGDISGNAGSDASSVYVSGILVEYVSSDTTTREGSIAGDADIVDLEIQFDVTAIGDDEVWVERDFATQGAVADVTVDGNFWATTTDSTTGTSSTYTPTLSATGSTSDDDTSGSDQDFHFNSGQTRTLTFRVSIPAGGDNVNAGARITGIKWGTTDADDNMNNLYTFNLSDVKTDTVTGLNIH